MNGSAPRRRRRRRRHRPADADATPSSGPVDDGPTPIPARARDDFPVVFPTSETGSELVDVCRVNGRPHDEADHATEEQPHRDAHEYPPGHAHGISVLLLSAIDGTRRHACDRTSPTEGVARPCGMARGQRMVRGNRYSALVSNVGDRELLRHRSGCGDTTQYVNAPLSLSTRPCDRKPAI
jgi:hypothetical protein